MKKITGKILKKCNVKKSLIHGWGVFAGLTIERRQKIGSFSGIIIRKSKIPTFFPETESIAIVELWNDEALDSRQYKNELCFINHSCFPNCYMRVIGQIVEIYSLKEIKANTELTLDYKETHHNGTLSCKCQSKNCRGRL